MVIWKFCQNNPKEIPRPVWLGSMIISGSVFGSPILGSPLFPVARVGVFITGKCGGRGVGQIRT